MGIQRFGIIDAPGRPRLCLGMTQGNRFVFCTTARNRTDDINGQIDQILKTFDQYLIEANVDKAQLLTAQVWLKRMRDFECLTRKWNNWIDPHNPPIFSCVRADISTPDGLVEIRITAALKQTR
jgi:enamine deaminase RidA (YjgF/YER057c/UK114 family)